MGGSRLCQDRPPSKPSRTRRSLTVPQHRKKLSEIERGSRLNYYRCQFVDKRPKMHLRRSGALLTQDLDLISEHFLFSSFLFTTSIQSAYESQERVELAFHPLVIH